MSKQTYEIPQKQGLYDPANEKDSCGVGFIAHIKGQRSHKIVQDAGTALVAMTHRGACGCESNTGDGAGILTALPLEFLNKVAKKDLGTDLPEPGKFAAGLIFLPQNKEHRDHSKAIVEKFIIAQGQQLLGWRSVPVDADKADIGPSARATEPVIEQLFIKAADGLEGDAFERQLYLIRKQATLELRNCDSIQHCSMFYICSLSSKVIIYKGQLMPEQVFKYYPDLNDPDYTSHLAMVHSRFSTNTFPSWDRAQPNRFM
ncbi:MAG: glutamate synthase subunit alpha, partial [Gammaproteobacteria bacterium]|nr:glutamate synthase subunit alpha [Gammaproteobacteria bacterium]